MREIRHFYSIFVVIGYDMGMQSRERGESGVVAGRAASADGHNSATAARGQRLPDVQVAPGAATCALISQACIEDHAGQRNRAATASICNTQCLLHPELPCYAQSLIKAQCLMGHLVGMQGDAVDAMGCTSVALAARQSA